MHIVHITPALPPVINGLGDFSKILVENFIKKGIVENSFLVFDQTTNYQEIEETVVLFNNKNLYLNLQRLKPDVIILHYVNYAYEKNGLPFYLGRTLGKYSRSYSCRVLVFFHELYSSSSNPFKLPFYSNYFQKKIVKSLYNLSFMTFTNCEVYQKLLKALLKTNSFNSVCTGIYSNISDSFYNPRVKKRDESMVVFGSFNRRSTVYQNPKFIDFIERNKIKEIFDIGPGTISFAHPSLNFISKGSLSPNEVALLLNDARFGAIDYSPEILAKSGIFSAYAAFGVITINVNIEDSKLYDKLVKGKNYFNLEANFDTIDLELIKQEVLKWYSTRNTEQITETIAQYLY